MDEPDARAGDAPLVLGDPDRATRADALRDGRLAFLSRHGVRATERLLVEALPEKAPRRLLTGLDTEGVVALAAGALFGDACSIAWWHLDAYVAAKVRRTLERNGALRVQAAAASDLPSVSVPGEPPPASCEPFDLVALPFPRGQEAQLSRELVEEAHAALRPGGRLLASTDDRDGYWLKKVLKEVLGNSTVAHDGGRAGLVLAARRTRERAVVRDHRHPLRATLRGRAFELESRPGVFGNARLDAGTRALAEAAPVGDASSVLDIGCGYGALGLAAAASAPSGRALLVDSNARAVALAERNAATNGIANARVLCRAKLEELGEPATYDLALANPPYFSGFRIARAFVSAASAALRPGGELWLVAKAADPHRAILEELGFSDVRIEATEGGHGIVHGKRGARVEAPGHR